MDFSLYDNRQPGENGDARFVGNRQRTNTAPGDKASWNDHRRAAAMRDTRQPFRSQESNRSRRRIAPIAVSTLRCALALLLLIIPVGCDGTNDPTSQTGWKVKRESEDARCRLTLLLSDDDVPADQPVKARLELETPAGYEALIPDLDDVFEQSDLAFEVLTRQTARTDPPEPQTDRSGESTERIDDVTRVWRRDYVMEFVLPGEYELPPVKASVIPPNSSDSTIELETEPATLVVNEVAGKAIDQKDWGNIKTLDPVELPQPWTMRYWWALPLALALLLAAVFHRAIIRKIKSVKDRPPRPAPVIPPHVWAREQLRRLVDDKLLEKGMIKEFHYRVSFIVRGYIERRYRVSAGEMTTEEFLEAVVSDRRFGTDLTGELRDFVDACDLVKYAGQKSTTEQSMALVNAADTFVDRTWRPEADDAHAPASTPVEGDAANHAVHAQPPAPGAEITGDPADSARVERAHGENESPDHNERGDSSTEGVTR